MAFQLDTLRILSNGFIVTSVIWASALAAAIDRQLIRSSAFFAVAAGLTLFGVMHSPLLSGEMFLPWDLVKDSNDLVKAHAFKYVVQYASGYALVAILLAAWGGHLWYHGYDLKPLEDH